MTIADIRRQYARNLADLKAMAKQAASVAPKKYCGFTAQQLSERVAAFERLVTLPDADLYASLAPFLRAKVLTPLP